jgi:hypothetical protein
MIEAWRFAENHVMELHSQFSWLGADALRLARKAVTVDALVAATLGEQNVAGQQLSARLKEATETAEMLHVQFADQARRCREIARWYCHIPEVGS